MAWNVILMMAAAVAAAPVPNAAAFDLVCSGKDGDEKSFTERYRLDLKAKRWCNGKCEEVEDILSVSDSKIVLEMGTVRPDTFKMTEISRQSGKLLSIYRGNGIRLFQLGGCVKESFSGFPPNKF